MAGKRIFILVVAIIPLAFAEELLLKWWPVIMAAYEDISQVYPAVLWINYILVFVVIASIGLYLTERAKLKTERKNSIRRLSDRERDTIREKVNREMQAERKAFLKSIDDREAAIAIRERELARENLRIQSAVKIAETKQTEYEKALYNVEEKTDQLNFWISQVDCAIEALVEDHEAVGKISTYLGQWVEKAVIDPQGFAQDIGHGRFDPKRFERSKRQLEKIYERYAEIQREMGNITTSLNDGGYNALDKK